MAIKHKLLEISKPDRLIKIRISFKNEDFWKFEIISGKLEPNEWRGIGNILPQREMDMESIDKQFKSVSFKSILKGTKSLYTLCLDEYMDFYWKHNKINYLMNGASGVALKQIIANLSKLCADDEELVLDTWKVILTNWHKLEEFYSKQMDLKQINSNLNIILTQIKNGKSTSKTKAAGVSKSARENL